MKPDAIFNMSPVKSKILKGTAIYFFLLLSQFTVGMEKISYAEDSQNIEYEKPPKFKASRMMPAHLLKGRGYKVEEEVFNDGFRNTYMIRSNYGFFNAYGDEMLRIRVNEVHAIDKLTHLKNSDEFLEGASKAINVPISLAKGIFNNPVDTVTGVGKGMGKFLGRIGEMATGKRGETEDHATKELIGFSAAKRMLAGRLKVDVYSTNKKLQEELDSVSWATFSGGFAVSMGMSQAAKILGGINISGRMNKLLQDNAPEDLRKINRGKLLQMRVSEELTDRFLEHPYYSPRHETILVGALEQMKEARSKQKFIRLALGASSLDMAFHFQRVAELMQNYDEVKKNIIDISMHPDLPNVPVCRDKDGTVILPLVWDYGIWNQKADLGSAKLASIFQEKLKEGRVKIWMSGKLSQRARDELEARGFVVIENAFERINRPGLLK